MKPRTNPMPLVSATEVGPLGVCQLKRLWSRVMRQRQGQPPTPEDAREAALDQVVLYALGLALEETVQFLFQHGPSYDELERWVLEKNGGSVDRQAIQRINAIVHGSAYEEEIAHALHALETSAAVLTEQDLAFWQENGYLVIPHAVSPAGCLAAEKAIWEFLGADPQVADTWYNRLGRHGIMVQLFHHPALAANRRSPRIHKAFAQLYGSADLVMTVDRVGFNPPERHDWTFPGPRLHWDASLNEPMPFGVQGLLYLTDTPANQGAFTCVPGFHRRLKAWLARLPADADPQQQDLESLGPIPIAGNAGDLIVWHQALPHGSRANHASRPRLVQYLTMVPARPG